MWSCPCRIAYRVGEALNRWRVRECVEVLRCDLLNVLASVLDLWDARRCRYPLAGLLAIAIMTTAAGMRGYAGFATWPAAAPPEMLAQLRIWIRFPSVKTFRSVLSRVDPADMDRRLGGYFTALAAAEFGLLAVPVDGKTFWNTRLLVTIDAMRTQTTTGRLICATLKSNYLTIVKSNHPCCRPAFKRCPGANTSPQVMAGLCATPRAESAPHPRSRRHRRSVPIHPLPRRSPRGPSNQQAKSALMKNAVAVSQGPE